jgi:hypothetical protein
MHKHKKQDESPGGDRDRTDDLLLAKQALSQLSYTPLLFRASSYGPSWIRTSDLTLIRGAL